MDHQATKLQWAVQLLMELDSVKQNFAFNRVSLSIPKTNTCGDDFYIRNELRSFKNDLVEEFNRLT